MAQVSFGPNNAYIGIYFSFEYSHPYLAYCSSSIVVVVDFAAAAVAGYEFDVVALSEHVLDVIAVLLLVACAVQLPSECMPSLELASSALTWPTFFD